MGVGEVWTPRRDQEPVLAWLGGRERGALWVPTGAGKTVLAATWLDRVMLDSFEVGRTLIVAPRLVVDGWLMQMERWRHLNALRPLATAIGFEHLDLFQQRGPGGRRAGLAFRDKRATKRRLLALPGRIHLCSWDAFPWVEEALGGGWPYDGLVLDESTFVKDMRSERGKAARRAVHKSGRVTHLLELTATPNSNHDEAVFAQLDLVERGAFARTLTEFRETYCIPASKNWQTGQVYSWKLAPTMRPQFEAVCQRLAISVPDQLGVELLEVEQWIDLPEGARREYRALERDLVLPDVTAANEAVLHAKLKQIAAGYVYPDAGVRARMVHNTKIQRFHELLEAIDGPVLTAYQWDFERSWLASLGEQFADIRQPGAKERFMRGELKVLGMHPRSAGHGVDGLQGASNHLIWTSVPDDRELYDQVNGRLKRPGQGAATVFAHVLIARDTREEDVWREVLPGKLTNTELVLRATRARASNAGDAGS